MAVAGHGGYLRLFIIKELALSTSEVSRLVRYILVVASESWPMPSLMTDSGMRLAFAAEAQLCRATYRVRGMVIPTIRAIFLRLWFML